MAWPADSWESKVTCVTQTPADGASVAASYQTMTVHWHDTNAADYLAAYGVEVDAGIYLAVPPVALQRRGVARAPSPVHRCHATVGRHAVEAAHGAPAGRYRRVVHLRQLPLGQPRGQRVHQDGGASRLLHRRRQHGPHRLVALSGRRQLGHVAQDVLGHGSGRLRVGVGRALDRRGAGRRGHRPGRRPLLQLQLLHDPALGGRPHLVSGGDRRQRQRDDLGHVDGHDHQHARPPCRGCPTTRTQPAWAG